MAQRNPEIGGESRAESHGPEIMALALDSGLLALDSSPFVSIRGSSPKLVVLRRCAVGLDGQQDGRPDVLIEFFPSAVALNGRYSRQLVQGALPCSDDLWVSLRIS